ncbi:MAG: HAMP domain-containing protein, partial [Chloroflexi bacterium]|nr:HAMP domain-containing protein [Chloroflexota bacterium]
MRRLQLTVLFIVAVGGDRRARFPLSGAASNAALSALTARGLLRPLRRLTTAMERVARGELSLRLPAEANDELGDLADGFNHMLAELEKGQRMRDLFGRYVSREVAAQALREGVDPGG